MTEEEKRILIERARMFLESLGFMVSKTELTSEEIILEARYKIEKEKKE